MSEIDIQSVATHGGAVLAASGGVAGFMRWLAGKEAQSVATELALLRNDVTNLTKLLEKHSDLGERVALLEASVKAAHERIDGKRRPR